MLTPAYSVVWGFGSRGVLIGGVSRKGVGIIEGVCI